MADLPAFRVVPSTAFAETGVDFFGPIIVEEKKERNRTFIKTYGCVFVCIASKAVHIEVASDMSTQGFLACFRRFISIRGKPRLIKYDNRTNFVGVNNDIQKVYQLHATSKFRAAIQNCAASERIEWQFNPPLSPHLGGLWEAAVKGFKHHLDTLLKEMSAVLNSRPLYVNSADPNDALAITPAHLSIGRPFNLLPESNFVSVLENRLTICERISKARQDFWQRWHKEYLHELQVRQKWLTSTATLTPGAVVVSLEDNPACARWPLGVVVVVHPGSDGIAQVATIRTASGLYKRNITRLCILPISQNDALPPASQLPPNER